MHLCTPTHNNDLLLYPCKKDSENSHESFLLSCYVHIHINTQYKTCKLKRPVTSPFIIEKLTFLLFRFTEITLTQNLIKINILII